MSKSEKPQRKTITISLISGKGGVGKTALTASMGKLLALMGYNVLLIDSDLITHGLTFLLGFNPKIAGLLEYYNNFKKFTMEYFKSPGKKITEKIVGEFTIEFEQSWTCKITENLDFLQSTSMPSRKYSRQVSSESEEIALFLTELLQKFKKSKEYDFILIDTEAGSVDTTRTAVSISDKVVTVMEPDPVGTYATENIIGELSDELPHDSFYLINKLSVEEAGAYEALELYLKMLRHLPPVPFDFEVRRAFMIRQIPVDEKKPSAFLFGVIRMIRDLLPDTSERLDKLEKETEERAILPIKKKMQNIENQLDSLAASGVEVRNRLEAIREKKDRPLRILRQYLAFVTGGTVIVTILFALFTTYLLKPLPPETLVISIITLLVTVVTIIVATQTLRGMRGKDQQEKESLEKELAKLLEVQDRTRKEYESYKNLLITRSKELTLNISKAEED